MQGKGLRRCWENSDLMNKGLRHPPVFDFSYPGVPVRGENSDLMNKGLRHPCETCSRYLSLTGENSDLMNKGLRHSLRGGHIYISVSGENSDLMNKGLRHRPCKVYRILPTEERILTWWIKDCDNTFPENIPTQGRRENSDLMNKGLRLTTGMITTITK